MNDIFFVCAGSAYLDIDAYACCVSYTDFLRQQNKKAYAYSTSTPNYSVPNEMRLFGKRFFANPFDFPTEMKKFIIVDVSNPSYFEKSISMQDVIEVIDHHTGFENYWSERIGANAQIEFIGAASTLIFEKWNKANLTGYMSSEIAKLLLAGILDNTLDLKACVTSQRDINAYAALCRLANVDDSWRAYYFSECQNYISKNIYQSINGDMKIIDNNPFLPSAIGQISVWDAPKILENRYEIEQAMYSRSTSWLLNVISIKENRSYFFCKDQGVKSSLEKLLGICFVGDVAISDRMWLRKEIMKEAYSKT